MKKVEGSSNIEAIGYNNGVLSVQFRGGNIYHYEGVTPEQHKAFMNADSYGSHFHAHIKSKFVGKKDESK